MNNNITEDYCSFEVSKLLKEKGFAVYCTSLYTEDGKQNDVGNYNGVDDDNYISFSRPTHALAIEWIRENFGIHIYCHSEIKINGLEITQLDKYQGGITRINHTYIYGKINKNDIPKGPYRKPCNTPYEAIEAALLYTLKNLI